MPVNPFIGQIMPTAFNVIPKGWHLCDGSLLPINQYQAVFALIGTTYGGNGTTNFGLPNLNGHIATSQGQGPGLTDRVLGETWGEPQVTLMSQQMASHTHALQLGGGSGGTPTVGPTPGAVLLAPLFNGYVAPPSNTTFATTAVGMTGGGQPHNNMQPTLVLVYCIALTGIFPSFN
jgi:microcystin-dependent protein